MMLHGRVLYRDISMGVLPLPPVVYSIALLFFGHSMTSVRIMDLFWTAGTAWLIFLFVRRVIQRPWPAAGAGALYSFLYYLSDYWNTAQPDGMLNLPLAGAMLLVLPAFAATAPPTGRVQVRWIGAGILVGVSVLFKYTIGMVLPALALAALLSGRGRASAGWIALGWLLAGFALAMLATALALLLAGALKPFVAGQTELALPYAAVGSGLPLGKAVLVRLLQFGQKLWSYPESRLGALVGTAGLILAPVYIRLSRNAPNARRPAAFLLTVLWLGSAIVSVCIQGKYFRYHFLPMLAPLAALGSMTLAVVFPPKRRWLVRPGSKLALALVMIAAAMFWQPYPARLRDLAAVAAGRVNVRDYWASDRHNSGTDFSLRDVVNASDYIRSSSAPTDRVYVWGLEPLINFLARRWTVTRFIYNFPLTAAWAPASNRAQFMTEYQATPAELFVVTHGDQMPWVLGHNKDSFAALMEFPELRDFIAEWYQPEVRIGRFDVFRLAHDD
jgi:4-amino-4-deoxy-L-arabinose transferase-like glycosyltransferase